MVTSYRTVEASRINSLWCRTPAPWSFASPIRPNHSFVWWIAPVEVWPSDRCGENGGVETGRNVRLTLMKFSNFRFGGLGLVVSLEGGKHPIFLELQFSTEQEILGGFWNLRVGFFSSTSGCGWNIFLVGDFSLSILQSGNFFPKKPWYGYLRAEDHASSPFFHLPAEGVLNFAWYSPPSFRSATENVPCLASWNLFFSPNC